MLITALGMARKNHEVSVAARRGGVLEGRAREAGLQVHPIGFHGDLAPGAVFRLARAIRSFHPDIVHAHDAHALGTACLALRAYPAAALVASRRVDFALRNAFSRLKYLQARRIIAASRAIAAVLNRDGIPDNRIRVVYEGVPDRNPRPGGKDILRELGVPDGCMVVGNVAALTDHKDHFTLIEAAAIVLQHRDDVRFILAGEGELRLALEHRLRELGCDDKILLIGFRNDIDMLMPAFDIFCLSSHMEGLGTSVLDAMAFGLPVVATNAGGIPEAVEDGVTGRIVPPKDPKRLADALLDLLGNQELRSSMGRAGRLSFERRFTAGRMVDDTLKVYAELR